MSFFSDLFEGNFSNLGTDIVDAPSSLINHPDQLAETLGAGAVLTGGALLGADLLGGAAAGADIGATAADAGAGAADLTAANEAFGTFGGLDAAAASDAVAAGDVGASLGGDALAFTDAPAFVGDAAPLGGDALAFSGDLTAGGDLSSLAPFDVSSDAAFSGANVTGLPGAGFDPTGAAAATPGGFAPTDAELTGGQTGTASSGGAGAASGGGASGGGGITSTLTSALSSPYTRLAVGLAPLALALGMGQPQLPSSAVAAQQNAAALSAFGQQQLQAGQAGQLNAGQLALLQQMRQDLTNQYRQALYNEGVTNPEADTRWAQMEAQIDMQVTAQTATMIQQEITNGLNALGSAGTQLNQIAQMQMTADQNFTNTLVNATKALAFAVPGSRPTIQIGA